MKRKIISACLCLCLILASLSALTACGKKDKKDESSALTPMDEIRAEMFKNVDTLVELGDYKSISVTTEEETVTDQDIQDYIDGDLEYYGEPEHIMEGAVADGDSINIDYVGKMDGEEFEGGSDQGHDLTIGSNSFIPGFEDQLIGMNVGETKTITVTFPEDYENNPDLAGKAAEFTVTYNYKNGDVIPAELTDELVASMGLDEDVKTVDDYKAYVKQQLEDKAASDQENNDFTAVLEELLNRCTVNGYHDDLDQDQMYEEEIEYMKQMADSYSVSYEEFVTLYAGQPSVEAYEEQLKIDIEKYCKRIMIYRAIAVQENIEITQDEYEAEVAQYSSNYQQYGVESIEEFEEQYSLQIYQYMVYDRVEEILKDNATITHTAADGTPADTATEAPADAVTEAPADAVTEAPADSTEAASE